MIILYYSYSVSMHVLQYVVIKHDGKDTILLYQYYSHTAHNTTVFVLISYITITLASKLFSMALKQDRTSTSLILHAMDLKALQTPIFAS